MQIQARRVSLLLLAAFAYAQEPVRLTPSPDRRERGLFPQRGRAHGAGMTEIKPFC